LVFVPLIAAISPNNYFLDKSQNAVTNIGNDGWPLAEDAKNVLPPRQKGFCSVLGQQISTQYAYWGSIVQ
jgi:hypothetical protein